MKLNTNPNPNCNFGMGINRFLSNTKIRKWVWFRLLSVKILFSQNTFFIYWGLNLLGSGTWLSWLILTNVLLNWNRIYRLQRGTVTLAHARRCDGRYIGVVSSRHVVLTELVSSVSTQHNIKTKKASVGTISIKNIVPFDSISDDWTRFSFWPDVRPLELSVTKLE